VAGCAGRQDVAVLVARDMSSSQITPEPVISARTVETRAQNIMDKPGSTIERR
jgi:DNA-binding NarL/FixJ family response regulator